MEQVRVLMVEDDENDAVLVRRELDRLNSRPAVQYVRTELAFVAALQGVAPHAILCDHNIPGFSGWRALELARAALPDVPFILVTGSLDEETAVAYLKGGAADYILKDRVVRLGPALLEALERAQQRDALRRHERLLRQIIDANPSLIFVKDWDGRFVLVNQATAEIYGTTVDSLVGKTDADFNPHAEEVAHFLRDDREVISSGRPKLVSEEQVTNPVTKQTRWYQTIKVPLRLPEQEKSTMLGVATEITERKRLEEQLLQSQKMEAVGQLAGGVAHDFNNILTAIVGYTDLLAVECGANSRQLEDLEEIRKAARRAAALTRQLLAFSRKQVLEPRIIDLNSVVMNLEKMLRSLISANIALKTALAPDLGAARADPNQLEQVIMNLAINARDAMPEGGTLTIETGNARLDENYAAQHVAVVPGSYVMLAVIDKAAPAEAGRHGGGTVLVVEDDEQLRRLTHRALAAHGYTVLEADRGRAALDIARRHQGTIDLLLTDIVMPDTNGRQLADTLRAARPGLRVLYMSGYPDGAIASQGMLESGVAYLAKPFTTDAITRKVREVLEAP